MYVAVIILIVLLSFILIFAILAQNSKGGMGSAFGGSGASQVMGVKRTGDFLERATWTLGAAILVLTLSTNFMMKSSDAGTESQNVNAQRAQESIPEGVSPLQGTGIPAEEGQAQPNQDELLDQLGGDESTSEEGGE